MKIDHLVVNADADVQSDKCYLEGHRGVAGCALDVPDLDAVYERLSSKGIEISRPEPLAFRWFFNLLTRTMPWRNAYVKPFEGVPFRFFPTNER